MNHLDLYSGFGAFRLAIQAVWPESKLIAFVEMEEFCQDWLKANWPGCRIIDRAEDVTYESLLADTKHDGQFASEKQQETERMEQQTRRTEKQTGTKQSSSSGTGQNLYRNQYEPTIDILTGGPPCQPVSVAGQGRGDSDDRWQWPTMYRIIQETSPRWIVFENVSNLVNFDSGLLFDGILTDMESEGYETTSFILPACSQNAPHRRDRVFVVGNANRTRQPQPQGSIGNEHGRTIDSSQGHVADTEKTECESTGRTRTGWEGFANGGFWDNAQWLTGHDGKARRVPGNVGNTGKFGLERKSWRGTGKKFKNGHARISEGTQGEFIPPFCGLDDGISPTDDRQHISLLTKNFPKRADFLKGFGNSIAWPVLIPIMQAIREAENGNSTNTPKL